MSTAVLFNDWLADCVLKTEVALEKALPATDKDPSVLHESMRYASLGGGKRIRAALVYGAAQAVNKEASNMTQTLGKAAAAVELIHAYSLVHDDLPCMDNDVLRRGMPTVHVKYGEAMALLAGDAIQPLAFAQLADMSIAPALVVQATQVLAKAAGSLGMAGGQAIDLLSVDQKLSFERLSQMHRLKTGAMIEASVSLGAIVAGASSDARSALEQYSSAMGLAFQVVDDILDATVNSETLGKTAGKDAQSNKPTYVTIMGLEASRNMVKELHEKAATALVPLGAEALRLNQIADFIIARHY